MSDEALQSAAERPKIGLTIAGFDPSNGAGITADLQVLGAHGVFGVSAITALTVQSTLDVKSVHPVDPTVLRDTLRHLTADIMPDGIKIGMLGSHEAVLVLAEFLKDLASQTQRAIPIVLDPVLKSSSGAKLLADDALAALHQELLPQVTWITPNWAELALLSAQEVGDLEAATTAAQALSAAHPHLNIVATGGDIEGSPTDLWLNQNGQVKKLIGHRVETTSTHGTGCAFSSALLCGLMQGEDAFQAVSKAKVYIENALRTAKGIGHGRGPMNLSL